jgi:hypothetical protein
MSFFGRALGCTKHREQGLVSGGGAAKEVRRLIAVAENEGVAPHSGLRANLRPALVPVL